MKIVMDADCLVKLTKAGIKEAVVSAMEIHIPLLVKKETVDEAKERGYDDAFIIEENIAKNTVHVVKRGSKSIKAMLAARGEAEVASVYLEGGYAFVASDDKRFLKKLETAGIPYITAAACVVYLYKRGMKQQAEALEMLKSLRPFVSEEEYEMARLYVEGRP